MIFRFSRRVFLVSRSLIRLIFRKNMFFQWKPCFLMSKWTEIVKNRFFHFFPSDNSKNRTEPIGKPFKMDLGGIQRLLPQENNFKTCFPWFFSVLIRKNTQKSRKIMIYEDFHPKKMLKIVKMRLFPNVTHTKKNENRKKKTFLRNVFLELFLHFSQPKTKF